MARPPIQRRFGKRRFEYEDWMEEDDFLGGDFCLGKRRFEYEDWMEEDDFLGGDFRRYFRQHRDPRDFRQHRDPRHKLQRCGGGRFAEQERHGGRPPRKGWHERDLHYHDLQYRDQVETGFGERERFPRPPRGEGVGMGAPPFWPHHEQRPLGGIRIGRPHEEDWRPHQEESRRPYQKPRKENHKEKASWPPQTEGASKSNDTVRPHHEHRPLGGIRIGRPQEEARRPHQEESRRPYQVPRKENRMGKASWPPQTEGASKSNNTLCFRCRKVGHHQLYCTNDPICYKCKQVGHMAAECRAIHSTNLKTFGCRIFGQQFYSVDIPADKFGALVVVQEGDASVEKIDRELKHLVKADWDFKVKQISKNEFRVAFPDQSSIDTFSKLTRSKLPLYGLNINIIKSNIDPATSSVLQSAWIKIYGLPDVAREEEIIKEIAILVGKPIKVDEFSLLRDPVRVRVKCPNPSMLRGSVLIHFNKILYNIRFVAEGFHNWNHGKVDSDTSSKQSDTESEPSEGESQDDSMDDLVGDGLPGDGLEPIAAENHEKGNGRDKGGDTSRKSGGNSDRSNKQADTEAETSQGESQDDSMEDLVGDGSPGDSVEPISSDMITHLAAFYPDIQEKTTMAPLTQPNEMVTDPYKTSVSASPTLDTSLKETPIEDFPEQDKQDSTAGQEAAAQETPCETYFTQDRQSSVVLTPDIVPITKEQAGKGTEEVTSTIPTEKILVHNQEGTYLMDADKWPVLEIASEHHVNDLLRSQEEDLIDNFSLHSFEAPTENDATQEGVVKESKKRRRRKKLVAAVRSSKRVPRDGIPIATKAMMRVREKNEMV